MNIEKYRNLEFSSKEGAILRSGLAPSISFLQKYWKLSKNTEEMLKSSVLFQGRACTVKRYLLGQGSLTPFTSFVLVSNFIMALRRS